MELPKINPIQTARAVTEAFRGYNHNLRIADGEWYDMENITGRFYPVMSPRKARGTFAEVNKPNGLINKDALCWVDGTKLYVNRAEVAGLTLTDDEKTLVSMGAYIIIFPDKKYVNTKDLSDYGSMEASFDTGGTVTFEMCREDGTVYENVLLSPDEPGEPENMDLWMDTSTTPHTLLQFSSFSGGWVSIATTYVRISAANIAKHFSVYDGVKVSGVTVSQVSELNDKTSVIWGVHRDEENDGAGDYIVMIGILDERQTQEESVHISRTIPVMDYVIESRNRLWGCRYGLNANGDVVNEIYCSKLGDFKNWNVFQGISTDSYAASLGSDGEFTGAIDYLGYPLFFKENCLHKVYGSFPSDFQIQTTQLRGVQKGCHKSLAIVNEVLYYKARGVVVGYDGSLPIEISSALGEVQYGEAVGGVHRNSYWISMKDEDGDWHLFEFYTKSGMWFRQDATKVEQFCAADNELYFIADGKVKTMFGGTDGPVDWMVESGPIGMEMPDKKYLSRLVIRMSLAGNPGFRLGRTVVGEEMPDSVSSMARFLVRYDEEDEWTEMFTMNGTSHRTFTVPIKPHRCDHFRLRIEGSGDAKIYSITKTIEQGSDF